MTAATAPIRDVHENEDIVRCICCRAEFAAFAPGQASDCASEYEAATREITGYYGSATIDMETHIIAAQVEMPNVDGIVCDACITKMMEQDALTSPSISAEICG